MQGDVARRWWRSELFARASIATRVAVLPCVVALPALAWVIEATRRASLSTLGRDQGIFQYIAWAVAHGAKDYADIRDVNGPLTHIVHLVFLALGGADEHRFRVLDLTVTGVAFAGVGACLPGLSRSGQDARPPLLERLAWAFAGWVVLSAQYLRYLFWDLAQRESFFDWFMLAAVGLQLAALSPHASDRARRVMLVLSGALSFLPWFGKPTYALFTLAQLATFAVVEPLHAAGATDAHPRRAWLRSFLLGGVASSLAVLGYLLVFADLGSFLHIYFVDVPRLYRFIWPRTALDSLSLPGYQSLATLGIVSSVTLVGLLLDGQLPRRLLAVSLVPLAGVASVIAQAKGFPYHFHPVSAGLYLHGLVIVVWLSEQLGRREAETADVPPPLVRLLRLVPFAAATALSLTVLTALLTSPHLNNNWILEKGITAELRRSHDYLVYFRTTDFYPWEMRETAAYLDANTQPDDTVQEYGMDPYLLFLARRRSATPYIYAYDLNVDAALWGSGLPEGLHPTPEQADRIRALRDDHEGDLLERVRAKKPAAFVFMDGSPLMTTEDAWIDFAEHNPTSAPWVSENYKQTAVFGPDRVWLRRDLAVDMDEVPRSHGAEGAP